MNERIDRNDPVENVAEEKEGKFEEAPDGYTHFIPDKEKLSALNSYLTEEICGAENDHTPYFNEIADNYEAYYGKGGSAMGDDVVLQLPIVNRCIDLMVSWYVLQTMRQTPVVSFKPYHDQEYSVTVPSEELGVVAELAMSGEDLATAYERGFDKILREKCDFRRWYNGVVKEAHIAGRAWSKVYYRRDQRTMSVPMNTKNSQGIVSATYEQDAVVMRDDPCRFERVPVTSILTPIDQQHPQKSDWIAEKVVMSNTELRQRFANGSFPLVSAEEMTDILETGATSEYRNTAERRISGQIDKQITLVTKRHVGYMVWFDLPIKMKQVNPATGATIGKAQVVMVPVCGLFHREKRKLLCIYKNPYSHKQRPYSLFMEEDSDDNEFGLSVVGKIKKHSALISQMLHLDIQNAVQSVNVNWMCDPNSPAYQTLVNEEDFPGRVIPRRSKDEVEPVRIGRPHGGLGDQMNFVSDDLYRTVNLSIYEEGMHVPGRTAAASIKQIMDAGYQKPMKTMLALSQFTADTLRLWMEVKRQYEPLGETFAQVDDETRELMEAVIRYPTGVPLDMFRISLTASDEFMARDEDSEERMMIYNLVTQNNTVLSQMMAGLTDLGAPPSIIAAIGDMANAQIDALKYVVEATRKDSDKFGLDKKAIAAILQEREMAAMMQQQMGGPPNAEQGAPGAPGPTEGQPPMAGGGGAPPPPQGPMPGGPPN